MIVGKVIRSERKINIFFWKRHVENAGFGRMAAHVVGKKETSEGIGDGDAFIKLTPLQPVRVCTNYSVCTRFVYNTLYVFMLVRSRGIGFFPLPSENSPQDDRPPRIVQGPGLFQ